MGRRPVYVSPRMVVEFEMDRRGIREVARGKELRLAVGLLAKKAKVYAESIAPEQTGRYRKSFEINFARVTIAGMRRVVARLVNTDPAAAAIEWGNERVPVAHHTLTKTLAFLDGRPVPAGDRGILHARDSQDNLLPGRPLIGPRPAGGLRPLPYASLEEFRDKQRRRRESDRRARARRRARREGR